MNPNEWTTTLSPVERQAAEDLAKVATSFEWIFYVASGLGAIVLFTIAANRSREGDTLGAVLSSLAAVLSATAPIIAKSFSIGGN